MRLILTSGNWLADALPNGAYAVINDQDGFIETHRGTLHPGERILYPRITTVPIFKVAGQTHADPPRVLEFVDGAAGHESGWFVRNEFHPSGTSPVIYDLLGQLCVAQPHTGNGSQGYRYVAPDGRLVTGDATYGPFRKGSVDLFGWTSLAGWLVGQGPEVGCWAYRDGHGFTDLAAASAALHPDPEVAQRWRTNLWQFVRFSVEGDRFALAAWVMHAPSVLLFGTLEELAALPTVPRLPSVTSPAPVPPPPAPTPEPEPTPMPGPINLVSPLPMLAALRGEYPDEMTPDQCVDLLNRAAFAVGNGWGLLKKTGGNRGVRFDGVPCSVDWLVNRPAGLGGDFLIGAGSIDDGPSHSTPSEPTLEPFDLLRWVAPIAPVNAPHPDLPPGPDPLPEPPPLPTPGNTCQCDMAAILAEFKEIKAALARLEKPVNVETQFPLYEGTLNLGWLGTKQLTLRPKAQE